MPQYSEQDLKYASEFREGVHREALAIVRKTRPYVTEVVDRHPVEDYFQEHWDYPGKWYTIVAIPNGCGSREALVDQIVHDTLSSGKAPEAEAPYTQGSRETRNTEPGRRKLTQQLDAKPDGYAELFVVDTDQNDGSFRAVGTDAEGRHILEHYEEYRDGGGSTGAWYVLTDPEFARYIRLALLNGQLSEAEYDRLAARPKETGTPEDDAFYRLLDEYPDLVVDYCIVRTGRRYLGYDSHREALKTAYADCCEGWTGDPVLAVGKTIPPDALFSSNYQSGGLNYRRAFLYPPHGNGYTGKDFARVNAALFPKGTDALTVYEWTTDWSEYFDDGHEWWGALCLTVYDESLDRFVVLFASATD